MRSADEHTYITQVYRVADEASAEVDEKLIEVLVPSGSLMLDFEQVL